MGGAAKAPRISLEDCLAWKETQGERHQFVDGEVDAMAGADD
jgi:hypothetical protein